MCFRSFCERSITPESTTASILSYSQSMNGRAVKEERAKWNLYDPFYKEMALKNISDGPGWLDRSVKDCEEESIDSLSFVRGQNAPVDPAVLAARELKRKKALELQDAIKQQLEEREMIKKYEREKQLMEEKLEEQRLLKQLQEEQERLELEQKIQRTRQENEMKKQELMRKAIEKAAFEAKLEKEKRKGRLMLHSLSPSLPLTNDISAQENEKALHTQFSLDEKQRITSESKQQQETDPEGEKILIGTPIKMKKKHLKNIRKHSSNLVETTEESTEEESSSTININTKKKPENKDATDIDGISLQVQSLIPVVPMQFGNNFFGIAPQSNFSNVQLLMIAQPNHMLATQSHPLSMYQNFGMANVNTLSPHQSDISQPCIMIKKETSPTPSNLSNNPEGRPDTASTVDNQNMVNNENYCNMCNKYHIGARMTSSNFKQSARSENVCKETPQVPHDGTFTKEILPCDMKLDAATSTNDDLDPKERLDDYKMRSSSSHEEHNDKKSTIEIGIQTEFDCEYCQHKFGEENNRTRFLCHSSSTINHKNERQKYLYEHGRSEEEMTMTTTTTTIVKKEKKYDSIQDRPKWGVRIPTVQYLKASEKDPFYQRNRRRRYMKTSKSLDQAKVDESSSSEAPPRTPSSHHSVLRNKKGYFTSRNVCTELLPIKTDGNGKVYFIREKSFVINEQMRSKPGLQGIIPDKILDRRPSEQEESYHSDKNLDFDSIDNSRTSSVEFN